jgi:hypothetical protein
MRLAAAAFLAVVGSTSFTSIDLLKTFHRQLPKIHRATSVPVLLPARLPLAGNERFRVYATGGATRRAWDLELASAPRCGGANACFVASFDGQRSGHLPARPNLRLSTGERAFFHPISCGASCSPASLWFVHGGVLYTWQLKEPPKHARAAMARLAAAAIRAGPR